jgi:hypothetical protein
MKLVWHIARKDLGRMAIPVALWMAFVVGTAMWFHGTSPAKPGDTAPGVIPWLAAIGIWTQYLAAAKFVTGYLLIGAFAVEEPLVGTDNFWMTRPIAGVRLLSAKLIAAGILFVIAPAALLGIFRLVTGWSVSEIGTATADVIGSQILLALPALAVASLSRTLVQFVFATVCLSVGFFFLNAISAGTIDYNRLSAPAAVTRNLVTVIGCAAVFAIVLVHQYQSRRRDRSWAVLILGLLSCIIVSAALPWQKLAVSHADDTNPSRGSGSETPEISVEKTNFRSQPGRRPPFPTSIQANVWLNVSPSGRPDGSYYAPASAIATLQMAHQEPATPFFLERTWGWDVPATAFVLGRNPAAQSTWTLFGIDSGAEAAAGTAVSISGDLTVWILKPRILGELPRRLGARFSNGASTTRLIAIESPAGWRETLVIEERDARRRGGIPARDVQPNVASESDGKIDVFVLANRKANRAAPLGFDEIGASSYQGEVVGFRRLYVASDAAGDEWKRDAVILKVRLDREASFQRTFAAKGSVIEHEGLR